LRKKKMQNIKVGTPVYNYMRMNRIGVVVEIKTDVTQSVWMTEGSPTGRQYAVVEFKDGKIESILMAELMRADLD
jgi:hypothetical protein